MGGRLVDQEPWTEETTDRQGLGGRRDSQTGRDRQLAGSATGRIGGESGNKSRESSEKLWRQSGREYLEGED